MSLTERFAAAPVATPAPGRSRERAMRGWEPGVRVEPAGGQTVTTPAIPSLLEDQEDWTAAVADMGVTVPDGYAVRLVEMRYDEAAWTRAAPGEDAVTKPAWRYKFRVEPSSARVNMDELLNIVQNAELPAPGTSLQNPGRAFLVAIGDTQFGKVDGDGVEGTIKRVLASTERAAERLVELQDAGHAPATVYVAWLGDCIEGFNSQGGDNAWRTPMPLVEQVRITRRLMLHQLDTFRHLAHRVVLLSVPGNHDQAVRFGKLQGRYDDSWAIESAVSVSDAMELNPDAYGRCSVKVPGRDEQTLTVDMAGTTVGLAHGDQMRAGKAHEWWAGQAHGMQPIGDATLLLTAHFHHLRVEQPGAKTWIQVPAMESESTWWRHTKGQVSPAGVVTALVGGGSWSDLQVL